MENRGPATESRRVRYTRKALEDGLLTLLVDAPINKITVSRLCEVADVNRSTFYAYYRDVFDLREQIEKRLYLDLQKTIIQANQHTPNDELLERIFEVLNKNQELCRVLLGKHGDKEFLKQVSRINRDHLINEWRRLAPNLTQEMLEYLHAFTTYGIMGFTELWVRSNFAQSPKALANVVSDFLTNGIKGHLMPK